MKKTKAGKKEGHEDTKPMTIWFDAETAARLDRLALKGDIPRAKLVRNLSVIGVEYLEACEKFGFLQTALILRDFGRRAKAWAESGPVGDVERA
jgi:hypothetical protein